MSLVFNMAGGAAVKLVSLSIKTPPTKTSYTEGEIFSTSGMVVQATYSNGVTATVTGYSYSPTGALTASNTSITISYTEGGVTVTTTQAITVKKAISATFANNDWSTIIEACHNNTVPSTWVVGNNKTMTVNGRSYKINIIGKNHDTYSSGGTAPLTFQLNGYVIGKTAPMTSDWLSTNAQGWSGCAMRNTTLPEVFDTLPVEVQDGIRSVVKRTTKGDESTTIVTTDDTLFLLSEVEMFGSTTYSGSGEGSQYAYYSAGNTISSAEHVWFRSPFMDDDGSYCGMAKSGYASFWGSSTKLGISFAFCF